MSAQWWTARGRAAGCVGPVTIVSCSEQRGWSNCDHLITDRGARALVGSRHRSLSYAVSAADRACGPWSSAAWLTVRDRHGALYQVDTSADMGIPGRDVCAVRRIGGGL